MRIITYATDSSHSNIQLLKKALDIELIPNYIPWTNTFYSRSYGVYKYLEENTSLDDLVLFCDAYDVLPINGCDKEILSKKILSIFDINKITFNAETNCYPDGCLADKYPDNDSKWKFLNAGIYFGISNNIRNMYQMTLEKIKYTDDQLEFSKLFLENANLIDLDYNCQIFQTLYDGRVGGDINEEDFIFDTSKKTIKNKHFDTQPLLFHGNGKINMSKLHPYL